MLKEYLKDILEGRWTQINSVYGSREYGIRIEEKKWIGQIEAIAINRFEDGQGYEEEEREERELTIEEVLEYLINLKRGIQVGRILKKKDMEEGHVREVKEVYKLKKKDIEQVVQEFLEEELRKIREIKKK